MVGIKAGVVITLHEVLWNCIQTTHVIRRIARCTETCCVASSLEENENHHGLPYQLYETYIRGCKPRNRAEALFWIVQLHTVQSHMERTGKVLSELSCISWVKDLPFMVDITQHLNRFNIKTQQKFDWLQSCCMVLFVFFKENSCFSRADCRKKLCTLPNLQILPKYWWLCNDDQTENYNENISQLKDFEPRFFFRNLDIFRNPSEDMQLEVIQIQNDSVLKEKFSSCEFVTFYQHAGPNYTKVKCSASKVLSMFGRESVCKHIFSVMNISKTCLHSRISEQHHNSVLRIAASQNILRILMLWCGKGGVKYLEALCFTTKKLVIT